MIVLFVMGIVTKMKKKTYLSILAEMSMGTRNLMGFTPLGHGFESTFRLVGLLMGTN